MTQLEDYLSLVAAAAVVGIHPQSLRRLMLQGRGPPAVRMQAGTGRTITYLFERHALAQWAQTYDPKPGRFKRWGPDGGRLL